MKRTRWYAAALVSAAIIAFLTLTPSSDPASGGSLFCFFCAYRALADGLLNLVLFIPLGVSLYGALRSARIAALACVLFSLCIELAQWVWIPGRDSNPSDLVFNSLGGILGVVVTYSAPRWLNPAIRRRMAVMLLAFALGAIATAAVLLAPHHPQRLYFGQWTPRLDNMAWYRGEVLEAAIGDMPIPSRRVDDTAALRSQLERGAPIHVRVVAGPPTEALAPIFSIADEFPFSIRFVGIEHNDAVYRFHTRAGAVLLDEPSIRIPDAFAGLQVGDTFAIAVRGDPDGICLDIAGRSHCGLGYRLADTWQVLISPDHTPPVLMLLVGLFCIAALLLPAGFFLSDPRSLLGASVAVGAVLLIIPAVTSLLPASPVEILAGIGGLAAGFLLRRTTGPARRREAHQAAPVLPDMAVGRSRNRPQY